MTGSRHQRPAQHGEACGWAARTLLLLLIGVMSFSISGGAVLLSERPGNVLTLLLTDCAHYQDWQTIAAVFAWRRSKQPGALVRVANCNKEDTAKYDKRMLDYVDTHMAPQFAYNEELKDWYAAYNKPGAVVDFFKHRQPHQEYVVVLDSDMLLHKPFYPERLNVSAGWALAAHYDYLKGVDNELALRHVPDIQPRNDSLAGSPGRRGDRVGGPYYMHRDDLRRLAPAWLNWTRIMRTDMEAYKDSGDTASKKGDRIWIAEMYGYAFGAARLGIWHRWSHDFMLYPGYTPSHVPHVMHYGLIYHVGDWTFDKHWYFGFDAHACPPWELGVEKPTAGIFPPPPHPDNLTSSDFLSRYKELLAVSVITTVNAGLCDYHVRNCPPSQQLTDVCNKAFALDHAVEAEIREHERVWDCTNHNKECDMWAKRGECVKSDAYMHDHCPLACNFCNPHPQSPLPEDGQALTVESILQEVGEAASAAGGAAAGGGGASNSSSDSSSVTGEKPAAAADGKQDQAEEKGQQQTQQQKENEDTAAAESPLPSPSPSPSTLSPAAAASPLAAAPPPPPPPPQQQQQQQQQQARAREEEADMKLKYPASSLSYAALVKRCTDLQGLSDGQVADCVKAASYRLAYPGRLKPLAASADGTAGGGAGGKGDAAALAGAGAARTGANQQQAAGSAQDLAALHAIYHGGHGRYENVLSQQMSGTRGGLSFLEQSAVVAVVAGLGWLGYSRLQQFRQGRAKFGHTRSE